MVALALLPTTPSRLRCARLHAVAARRMGKMRTRQPCCRRSRRVTPYTAVWVGEASHPGPLFTKHLPCPHCSTWLSHSGSLREDIQRSHVSPPSPPTSVLGEWLFTQAQVPAWLPLPRGTTAAIEPRRAMHCWTGRVHHPAFERAGFHFTGRRR